MENNEKIIMTELTKPQEQVEFAPSMDKAEDTFYGKFKSKESLIKSYENLERELTDRATKLKKLESVIVERKEDDKWGNKVKNLIEKFPIAKDVTEEISSHIANNPTLITDENCLELALLNVLAKKNNSTSTKTEIAPKEDVSKDTEINVAPSFLVDGGSIPTLAPPRPKTIKEAGKLAFDILAKK